MPPPFFLRKMCQNPPPKKMDQKPPGGGTFMGFLVISRGGRYGGVQMGVFWYHLGGGYNCGAFMVQFGAFGVYIVRFLSYIFSIFWVRVGCSSPEWVLAGLVHPDK